MKIHQIASFYKHTHREIDDPWLCNLSVIQQDNYLEVQAKQSFILDYFTWPN